MSVFVAFFLALFLLEIFDSFLNTVSGGGGAQREEPRIKKRLYRGVYQSEVYLRSAEDGDDGLSTVPKTGVNPPDAKPRTVARTRQGAMRMEVNYAEALVGGLLNVETTLIFYAQNNREAPHLARLSSVYAGSVTSTGGSGKTADPPLGVAATRFNGATRDAVFVKRESSSGSSEFLGKPEKQEDVICNLQLQFTPRVYEERTRAGQPLLRSAVLESEECRGVVKFFVREIDLDRLNTKGWNYASLLNVLTILEMLFFAQQITETTHHQNQSLVTLGLIAILNVCDTFFVLVQSGADTSVALFDTFAMVVLFKFLLFAMLQVRFLTRLWSLQNPDSEVAANGRNPELARFYVKFYAVLIGALFVTFSYTRTHYHYLVVLGQLYWIPQILHDVRFGYKNSLLWKFSRGLGIVRALPVLYQYGCPNNLFNGDAQHRLAGALPVETRDVDWASFEPEDPETFLSTHGSYNFYVLLAVCTAQAIQLGIMYSQRLKGARWFVPWMCLPHVYNYNRSMPEDAAHLAPTMIGVDGIPMVDLESGLDKKGEVYECVICMSRLDWEVTDPKLKPVCSPCNHWFHYECLEKWIDIKMECPTCRQPLPPLEI